MIRPLVLHPDPRLGQASAPVAAIDTSLEALVRDMFETMYAAPGRGLAAVQVGVLTRLFIMDATWKTGQKKPMVFINPELHSPSKDMVTLEEACLSIPDQARSVTRPARISARWQDMDGVWQEARFSGFEAACVQHEFDHLEGRLILDRAVAQ